MNEYLKLSDENDDEKPTKPPLSESAKQEIETQIRAHISNRMLHAAELKTWYETQVQNGIFEGEDFWTVFKDYNPLLAEQFRIYMSISRSSGSQLLDSKARLNNIESLR